MKKFTIVLGCIIAALVFFLSACEQSTPTISPLPTLSPIPTPTPTISPFPTLSPVPTSVSKESEQTLSRASMSQVVTRTIELWWDDSLVPPATLRVELADQVTIGEITTLGYTCEPSHTIACVNYPFSRTVPTAELNDNQAFTFTVVVDTEARIDDAIYDSNTQPLPFTSRAEPGAGRENDAVPWSWELVIPDDYSDDMELWQRIRGLDIDNNLPEVIVPYYVDAGGVQTHDSRGFFLVDTYTITPTFRMYMPIVARGN